jgi:hypothetical protein
MAGSVNDSPAPEPAALVGALADPHRLKVFAAVVLGARNEGEIAERADLPAAQVRAALARLVSAGLVEQGTGGIEARAALFARSARETALARRALEPTPEELGATPEQARRLRHVLRDGRIAEIPTRPAARRALLDFLAGRFQPGRRYSESEVNAVLARFHPDTAALRRYLVDEEFLGRGEGQYWRTGGTFELD